MILEGRDREALPDAHPYAYSSVKGIVERKCERIPNHDGTGYTGCSHEVADHSHLSCGVRGCRCHRRLLDLVWSAAFIAGWNACQRGDPGGDP